MSRHRGLVLGDRCMRWSPRRRRLLRRIRSNQYTAVALAPSPRRSMRLCRRRRLTHLARVRPPLADEPSPHRALASPARAAPVHHERLVTRNTSALLALGELDRGDDPPLANAALEHRDERIPEAFELGRRNAPGAHVGMDAARVQRFGAVDIPDAGEHRLVEQRRTDARARSLQAGESTGIRPIPSLARVALRRRAKHSRARTPRRRACAWNPRVFGALRSARSCAGS